MRISDWSSDVCSSDLRAALLNPAINPARDLAGHIGDLTSFHDPDDHFYFRAEYVTQLRVMTPRHITRPERYFAVKIGRASCRERGCQYVLISVGAVSLKKKKREQTKIKKNER